MATAIANAVDEDDLGVAGATQQMVNQVGVVIGIQVMQAVQAARAPTVGAVAAYGEAYLVGAAMAAARRRCSPPSCAARRARTNVKAMPARRHVDGIAFRTRCATP